MIVLHTVFRLNLWRMHDGGIFSVCNPLHASCNKGFRYQADYLIGKGVALVALPRNVIQFERGNEKTQFSPCKSAHSRD